MRAEEGKREREKEEKRKGKRWEKMGIKIVLFFISPCACFFFICAVVIFQMYKENCI